MQHILFDLDGTLSDPMVGICSAVQHALRHFGIEVADIRTLVLHPASSTHRQLSEEMLIAAGITPGLIRFSCGCENVEDILADIEQALAYV